MGADSANKQVVMLRIINEYERSNALVDTILANLIRPDPVIFSEEMSVKLTIIMNHLMTSSH